jgi:hypothetical protein
MIGTAVYRTVRTVVWEPEAGNRLQLPALKVVQGKNEPLMVHHVDALLEASTSSPSAPHRLDAGKSFCTWKNSEMVIDR